MTRINAEVLDRIRRTPDGSVLLFLTDRCPVGCAHCSVDSTPDGGTVTDYDHLREIVTALAERPDLQNVGISGGEPFSERRGMTVAMDVLGPSDKTIALYTSGIWAGPGGRTTAWHRSILEMVDTVILSTDAFHAARIRENGFRDALTALAATDAWIIVQAIATAKTTAMARTALEEVLGAGWRDRAEIREIPFMPYGRGAAFGLKPRHLGTADELGRCTVADSPVVRYTGSVIACCNEEVQMGRGPDNLRSHARTAADVDTALDRFRDDDQLRLIADLGAGEVARRAGLPEDRRYGSICELCWEVRGSAHATKPAKPAAV